MALDLTGRRVLITGGTRGIGLATGLAFGKRGARCALTCSWGGDEASVRAAFAEAAAPEPLIIQADVSSDEDTEALMGHLAAQLGGIDTFISNVALGRPASALGDLTRRDLLKAVSYSAWPIVGYTQALRAAFAEAPRYIVGMSSFGGVRFHSGYDAMAAAKAALEVLARYLAHHLHPYGTRVNVLRAGYVHTQSFVGILGSEALEAVRRAGQLLDPAEVAEATVALCSGWMDGITGQVVDVDRGITFYDTPMARYAEHREGAR